MEKEIKKEKKNKTTTEMQEMENASNVKVEVNEDGIFFDFESEEAKELFAKKQVEDVMNKIRDMARISAPQPLKKEKVVLALLNAHLQMVEADMILAKLKQEIKIDENENNRNEIN